MGVYSRDKFEDKKKVIEGLDKSDYNDFDTSNKHTMDIFLSYDGIKPTGFCEIRKFKEKDKYVVTISVAVLPEYRKKRIATNLVKQGINAAKKDPSISLIYYGLERGNKNLKLWLNLLDLNLIMQMEMMLYIPCLDK